MRQGGRGRGGERGGRGVECDGLREGVYEMSQNHIHLSKCTYNASVTVSKSHLSMYYSGR